MLDSLIAKIANLLASRYTTKAVTWLSGILIAKGALDQTKSVEWITTTSGVVLAGISWCLTEWQKNRQANKEAILLATPPPVTTSAPATNFTPGTSPNVLPLLVACCLATASIAQEPPVIPPSPPVTIGGVVGDLTSYLLHGSIGTGYGFELAGGSDNRNVMLVYSIDTPIGGLIVSNRSLVVDARLVLAYDTVFTTPVNRQHLDLGLRVSGLIPRVPAVAAGILNTPSDTVARIQPVNGLARLWPNLSDWSTLPLVGLRPEDIESMRFNYKRILIGLTATARFN